MLHFGAYGDTASSEPTTITLPDIIWAAPGGTTLIHCQNMASGRVGPFVEASLDGKSWSTRALSLPSHAGSIRLSVRNGLGLVAKKKIVVRVARSVAGRAVRILGIGDSLMEAQLPTALSAALEAMGARPEMIGTTLSGASSGRPCWTEARGGKRLDDFVYARRFDRSDSATMAPLPVGQEFRYLSLPPVGTGSATRKGINPFLVPSHASGSFNGYLFDVRAYQRRFGFDDPDWILVSLGTNDLFAAGASTAEISDWKKRVSDRLAVVYRQARRADPEAKIVFFNYAFGHKDKYEPYLGRHRALLAATHDLVAREKDSRLFWLPIALYQEETEAWGVHADAPNIKIAADALASLIAAE